MRRTTFLLVLIGVFFSAGLVRTVQAQGLGAFVESYTARLSERDHYNSNGQRLRSAAAIVRQDRANFYVYGLRDSEDEPDPYFSSKGNRARLEEMLENGRTTPEAIDRVVNGTPLIRVDIYATGISVTILGLATNEWGHHTEHAKGMKIFGMFSKRRPASHCTRPELMRRYSLLCCVLTVLSVGPGVQSAEIGGVPPKAEAFLRAYPIFFSGYKDNRLLFHDGGGMQFDDGRVKSYDELLANPDPEDELNQPYPVGPQSYSAPAVNFDPGRYRCAALFKKMYGETAKEVESHLVTIPWLPRSIHGSVRITRVNGVDRQLAAVSAELDELPPEEKKYVLKTGGTFNWRPIAGAEQLSAHSFGIAIDIDPDFSDYWRWASHGDHEKQIPYKNRIPHRIVEIFERHGFIWGGKWYHYDTMHFEYRPEQLPGSE